MPYYQQQCTKLQKEAYNAILKGVLSVDAQIRVPLISMQEFSDVYTKLRLDYPEIFYLTGFHIRFAHGADFGEFVPEYLFSKDKILSHQAAIRARIARIVRGFTGKTEFDKLVYLHSFITQGVHYDKLKKPYSHEIIGPLTQGVGVCEGIAKAVKVLADAMGLSCIAVMSAPAEGKRYGHAWNLFRIAGKWYHFDATFDLSLCACGEERFDYFLLSDAQIFRDHQKPMFSVPSCEQNDLFYYRAQKLSFTKIEDAEKRIAQAIRKKKPRFIFQWRGGYLTKAALSELTERIYAAASSAGKAAVIELNYPQAVFTVSFSDGENEFSLSKTDEVTE